MSTTVQPPARAQARPFLTMRVLRGLRTLVDVGWLAVSSGEGVDCDRDEHDALHAKRWVERTIAFKTAQKGGTK